MDIILTPAASTQVAPLTALSQAAFATDSAVGAPEAGGPPGYDDPAWHEQMRLQGHLYALQQGAALIGGALLFPGENGSMYLGRIFIDPALHRKGCGLRAMQALEAAFPNIHLWLLDTPVWNVRTAAFYPRAGYTLVRQDDETLYFEKRV